jgi:sugar lactone lactonase YvrE
MNKLHPIVTFSRSASRTRRIKAILATWVVAACLGNASFTAFGQEAEAKPAEATPAAEPAPAETKPADAAAQPELKNEPVYPLAVAVAGEEIFVVDLDLPGVWKAGQQRELFVRGTKLLRKPMNRPRCVIAHPTGGILVGDTATREIYWIESANAEPKPLNGGYIGIPMALALSPDNKTIYVGDAEKRATFRLPLEGGKPELVARVNARGLAFDSEGKLWAVTPDDAAIQRINVDSKEVENIVTGRPFQYPNGLCWAGDHGYVTDGYGKCIWKFTADGKTEKWHEGAPLVGPVGIAVSETAIFVADPKQKQVYEFNRQSKESKERL